MDRALYLFCLTRAGMVPELQMTGLTEDAPLFVEHFSDVAAIVCEVSLDDFSGPTAEQNLQDLEWVGPRAVRHGQVVEHVMRYSPVLPARFGTLFSDEESLDRLVTCRIAGITAFLDNVTDRDEWAVKGVASKVEVRERLFSERCAALPSAPRPLSPGLRYFRERQIRADVEKEMGSWLKETMNAVSVQLTERSTDWRRRKVVFRVQDDTEKETVVNWAFLVDRGVAEDFETCISVANDAYNDSGLFFELSGPWPPYSFSPPLELGPEA